MRVSSAPDSLSLDRHRDLRGRKWEAHVRHGILLLLGLGLILGLLNAYGQRPQTARASAGAASLAVYSPERVRGGLLFEARFTIDARQELKKATLVLESGWLEGMTVNTIEPSPLGEASRDGDLVLELGHVPAGDSHILFIQFQVNPTNVGRRSQRVTLLDGSRRIASVDRTVTVFP